MTAATVDVKPAQNPGSTKADPTPESPSIRRRSSSCASLHIVVTEVCADSYEVRVTGAIHLKSLPQLQARFAPLLRRRARSVTVDLTDVVMIDTAGLTVLLRATKAIASMGGRVVLMGLRPDLRRLLALTTLDRLLEIVD
jgi:anti-sigma B factor antagonist